MVHFNRLLPIAILSLTVPAQAQSPDPTVAGLVQQANAALKAGNVPEAARTCAAAVKLAPMQDGPLACAAALKDKVPTVAAAGAAILAGGDAAKSLEWCGAALMLGPDNADAQKCTGAASARVTARARDQVKLTQAAGLIDRGEVAEAAKLLAEVASSDVPEHLAQAHRLQDQLNSRRVAQVDMSRRADIARARALIDEGKRADAATLLMNVAGSTASQPVVEEARALLAETSTSWWTDLRDALRTPWIMQVLAGLLIIGGLWIVLHLARAGWRRAASVARTRKQLSWTFTGITEDKVVARDAVLDAIRRVPVEVSRPIWTPTRLLLYPGAIWEVWEDFATEGMEKPKQVHEPSFQLLLKNDDNNEKVLASAFQNLQFNVGGVAMSGVAQLWAGLVEWWRQPGPAVCGAAHEVDCGHETREVAIRLTASASVDGTMSVLASTKRHDGVDAVSLSAERAAYKLLATLGKEGDSARQIDGHAAFRQGVASMAECLHLVVDVDSAQERRSAALIKTIGNLDFARLTFSGDTDHRVYYLEATRLAAIAYACVGRDAAARKLLEDLQDATQARASERDRQLFVEAGYNLAMLHWNAARAAGTTRGTGFMAASLFEQIAPFCDEALEQAIGAWQLADLAAVSCRDWLALDSGDARKKIAAAEGLVEKLAAAADRATGADKRRHALLTSHARRSLATAQLRVIAAFELPSRGRFGNGNHEVPASLRSIVQASVEAFTRTGHLGPIPDDVLSTCAYGLLLQSQWLDAEEAAAKAIAATKKTDQFAVYVAAEAALQRNDIVAARTYLAETQPSAVTDPALSDLVAALSPDERSQMAML